MATTKKGRHPLACTEPIAPSDVFRANGLDESTATALERRFRARLRFAVGIAISPIFVGGLTLWRPSGRFHRGLVYWGPVFSGIEPQLREIVKPHGFDVSIVRHPEASQVPTATQSDRMGY